MENHLGTAGKPILTILEKNQIINTLVVVTRYFGGILLGTGGLVKAYSDVTLLAIEKSEFSYMNFGYEVSIKLSYKDLEKLKYFCRKNGIVIKIEMFNEEVEILLEVVEDKLKILEDFCNNDLKIDKIKILSEIYIRENNKI